jgi:hypothetical protein
MKRPCFKLLLLFILLPLSLSSCADIKTIMGVVEPNKDCPPGEYIGTAKEIKPGEVLPEPTVATPVLPSPPAVLEVNGSTINGASAQVAAALPALPQGDAIKINFLPSSGGVDGLGVLLFHNNSERFYWKNDGNNTNTWNVLFNKDQNIYTNIQNSFKFDGLITASEVENKLEGRLHLNYDAEEKDYYVEAYQYFKPEIIPAKDAISIKAGDPITIDVAKIGADEDALQITFKLKPVPPATEFETQLVIQSIAKTDKGTKMTLTTDKQYAKGDYSLWITRSGVHKSNRIPVKII